MDIAQLLRGIESAEPGPVYVLVGAEALLLDRAVDGLRKKVVGAAGIPGLTEDVFDGREASAGQVLSAAKTLPMMAPRRFVLLRHADKLSPSAQKELAAYLADPNDTTTLVLTAEKLPANQALGKAAKKANVRFEAAAPKAEGARSFIHGEVKRRGHAISPGAAEALLDSVGEDLSALDDGIERLSLYVGAGQRIDEDAVAACISRVRGDTIWTLVDAISLRDAAQALGALSSLVGAHEPGLRILAMVARQLRMVAKMRQGLADGASPRDAAVGAGAPLQPRRSLPRVSDRAGGRRAFEGLEEQRSRHPAADRARPLRRTRARAHVASLGGGKPPFR